MKHFYILLGTLISIFYLCMEKAQGQTTISDGNHNWNNALSYTAQFNGTLNRPVIILEGFDILNDYTEFDVLENWVSGGFINNDLVTAGYDIICVNFLNNSQNMHINKQHIKDFIQDVNNSKTGNEEGILIGESMGGIIARMALKELENENIDHQIGLYISYDSPHKGANIPIGFQTALRDVADLKFLSSFTDVWNVIFGFSGCSNYSPERLLQQLNSDASQQMIVKHMNGSTQYNSLQNYLNNLGYPNNSRNIALTSGSNNGTPLPFEAGINLVSYKVGACAVTNQVKLDINMTGINLASQHVSRVEVKVPPCIKVDGNDAYSPAGPQCFDNCPGGTFDIDAIFSSVDEFSFVPSVSAIDLNASIINGTNGLYYFNSQAGRTKDDIINSNLSPFDDIYANGTNSGHISLISKMALVNNILDREVMIDDFFLQNRTISNDRTFAHNTITVGKNINPWIAKNCAQGDVTFSSGTTVRLVGNEINLESGTNIEAGCIFSLEN